MQALTKKDFTKRWEAMTDGQRENTKNYWQEVYKNAIFIDTFKDAEHILLLIRDYEYNN